MATGRSFSSRHRRRALADNRPRLALLGVFAILFQALLFGWHNHPVAIPSHDPVGINALQSGSPSSPLADDDDCDICAALHHHAAAPLAFAALAVPLLAAERFLTQPEPANVVGAPRGFYARAPPQA